MTTKTARRASLIPFAIASALLVVGCGSNDDDTTPTTSAAATSMPMSMSMPTGTAAMPQVTKEQAEQTALATVPGGVVVSSELVKHDGTQVWHVHIRNTQGWDYDVDVDAASGAVVDRDQEDHDEDDRTSMTGAPNAAVTVTKEQAEQTALATVPGGTIVSSETNQHDGKTVWHVHIRNTQGWDYDVNVDAASGAVVN
ncbi:PepSY domain-containing protein [Rhodococcus sp. UNC363MFTsu5.1]|uniref:PepSY domain-containing protein n=1 Tax=Rhodococcus sp. UNC363MFTsu5.1 TaxID=1449069 RepID=UPI0004862653|nr:PepSY domain-containing protein [Rhodococcus sp. UNC363MFTsu5.1]